MILELKRHQYRLVTDTIKVLCTRCLKIFLKFPFYWVKRDHKSEVYEHLWITAALHNCSCTLHSQISNVTVLTYTVLCQFKGSVFWQFGVFELLLSESSPQFLQHLALPWVQLCALFQEYGGILCVVIMYRFLSNVYTFPTSWLFL